MNKKVLLPLLISGFLMSACSSGGDSSSSQAPSSEPQVSSEVSSESSSEAPADPVIHGQGAPSNTQGEQYSLYVDSDTGKIYEKNKQYVAPTSSLKRAVDESKWIYTNCKAGPNFSKVSPVADAIRNTLLCTNVTLKANDHIEVHMGSMDMENTSVAYIAYNVGNVIFKTEDDTHKGFDNAIIRAYSLYDIDQDQYSFFMNEGGVLVDRSAYIDDGDPAHEALINTFTTRCFNNHIEDACGFALCDKILEELDNFVVNDRVYTLNKTITGTSEKYAKQYGEGQMTFSNIEFKLNEDSSALEYFSLSFRYRSTDNSVDLVEDMVIEINNLRTTSFAVPE